MLGTMMLPGAVIQVPLYVMFANLNWLNTILPLIIPGFLGGGAMNVFLFRQFMRGLPKELEEAARVDGANCFIRYAVITLLSYVIGQRRYPIAYDLKSIVRYMSLAAVLLVVRRLAATGILWADTLVGTLLLAVFVAYVVRHDLPLSALPVVGRFFKK